jgi:zinc protease
VILLLALSLAAEPSAAPAPPDPLAVDARVTALPNGLRLVVEAQHRTDEVGLHLHVGVGARDERDGERGLAHLFEHLMFEGSANAPGNAYDAWLTAAGGDNNAFTTQDETAYHATFPSGALELALFLESDRLASLPAALTAENVSNQVDVVLQERAQGYAAPHGRDFDALCRLVWPEDHPYHVPVIGTVADLEGATVERSAAFFERWYAPANVVLGVVGNLSPDAVVERAVHWFSDVPSRPVAARWPGGAGSRRDGAVHGTLEDNVEDFTVHLAWPAGGLLDPDRFALEIAASILSDGRGTRLDELYYRRSWIRGTSAQLWAGEVDGMFLVSASTDRPARAAALERAVSRTLRRLADRGPTDDELTIARQRYRGRLVQSLERPRDRAEVLVDCVRLYGDPDCSRAHWAAVQALSPGDIRAALTRAFDGPRARLWVVPSGRLGEVPAPPRPVELP